MTPIVNRLQRDYAYNSRVTFHIIDFTNPTNQALVQRYGVASTPTFVTVRSNGSIVANTVGLQTYVALKANINKGLGK